MQMVNRGSEYTRTKKMTTRLRKVGTSPPGFHLDWTDGRMVRVTSGDGGKLKLMENGYKTENLITTLYNEI